MYMINTNLDRTLQVILEDNPFKSKSVSIAGEIINKIEDMKRQLLDMKNKLRVIEKKLCGDLAIGVRRRQPGLNVGVTNDGCKIGYRTKHLLLNPDCQKGIWIAKSKDPRFLNKFTRNFTSQMVLTDDLSDIIDAIITHFSNHYKSLGEDIVGTGIIMVEGKKSTIFNLARWSDQPRPRINSRLSKRV